MWTACVVNNREKQPSCPESARRKHPILLVCTPEPEHPVWTHSHHPGYSLNHALQTLPWWILNRSPTSMPWKQRCCSWLIYSIGTHFSHVHSSYRTEPWNSSDLFHHLAWVKCASRSASLDSMMATSTPVNVSIDKVFPRKVAPHPHRAELTNTALRLCSCAFF